MVKIDYTVSFDVDKIRSIIEPNDGYKWVYYDPLGMDRKLEENGKIFLSAYEKDTHNPIVVEVRNFPSTLWHRTKDKSALSTKVDAYGQPIVQEVFFNVASRRQWVNNWKKKDNYCDNQIVECRTPEDEFMQQVFWQEAQEETFNKGFQRIFYLDIETEISETSLMPFKALDRINMITIYDNKTDKFYTWSLQKAKLIDDGKHILFDDFNDNEIELLKHFLYFWADNYPDVVCGWNSRWYDMPYIVRRIENVLGKTKARYISPLEDYRIVHEKDLKKLDDKGRPTEKEEIEYVDIKGMFQADALLLYRDKLKVKQALDGGYGLSNVGMAEGLGAKVSYETTLKDLYNQDWQKFYEYNVRDVDLLHDIERNCNLITLARTIAGCGLANYDLIYQSTGYLVPTINIFAMKHRPDIIFNTYANGFRKKVKYEGAWVIPPTPGRYSHGTATDDYNSLYPSDMRMMNLSIETYVGRILDGYEDELDENGEPKKGGLDNDWMKRGGIDGYPDDYVFRLLIDRCDMETPVTKEVDAKTLRKMLETKLIICPTNMTLFLKHEIKRGVIADWCEVFYNRRKATKKEMFKCEKMLDDITDKDEQEKLKIRIGNLDSLQYALKIALNSIYGALGTTGCPFLHPIGLAQSVTRAGRFANSNGVKFYRQWLKENFNISDDYVVVASGDTDSFFMNLEAVTKDYINNRGWADNLNDWTNEQKMELFYKMKDFTENWLVPHVQDLITKEFWTGNAKVMRYGLEYITSGGIFESPKHYIVHKIIDGDTEKVIDKFKYTGIELKKAQIPAEVKKFMKDMYFTAVLDPKFNEDEMKKKIKSVYSEILKMTPNELGKWVGYSTERGMEGFLLPEKGATGVSKAVNYYNQIVKHLKLDKKYSLINVKDKVQMIAIKPTNKFGIDKIAFPPHQWPEEFNGIFEIDYSKTIKQLIIDPLKSFMDAMRINLHKYDPSISESLEYSIDDI